MKDGPCSSFGSEEVEVDWSPCFEGTTATSQSGRRRSTDGHWNHPVSSKQCEKTTRSVEFLHYVRAQHMKMSTTAQVPLKNMMDTRFNDMFVCCHVESL